MRVASDQGDQWIDNRARQAQDEEFCITMDWAFWHGLETPPMIGIDTRPGTSDKARLVPRREPTMPMRSVAGELLGRQE